MFGILIPPSGITVDKSAGILSNADEISFIMEDNFSYDEEVDEERDIRKKKLAYKEEIAKAKDVKLEELPHPETDEDRAKNPEWLVMLGVCTHLGCVPLGDKGEYGGWFCNCHGSHYDTSGRIRKGPAPTNMEVPKYEFVNSNTIKIG